MGKHDPSTLPDPILCAQLSLLIAEHQRLVTAYRLADQRSPHLSEEMRAIEVCRARIEIATLAMPARCVADATFQACLSASRLSNLLKSAQFNLPEDVRVAIAESLYGVVSGIAVLAPCFGGRSDFHWPEYMDAQVLAEV